MQTRSLVSYIQHKAKLKQDWTFLKGFISYNSKWGKYPKYFIPKLEMGFHYRAELWNSYLRELAEQAAVMTFFKNKSGYHYYVRCGSRPESVW